METLLYRSRNKKTFRRKENYKPRITVDTEETYIY